MKHAIFFLLLLPAAAAAAATAPEQSLMSITKHLSFIDFNPINNPRVEYDIKLLGDAKLLPQPGIIQIPGQHQENRAGRAIFSSPVRLLDPASSTPATFSTTFSFQINATGDDGDGDHGGSGLAFIAVPDELTVGRPGPWMGMMNDACDDDYKGFAVEFDTRLNPEFGDPNNNHVGVNLGILVSNKTADASDAGVSLNDGTVYRAWIRYDGRRRWIDIRVGPDGGRIPSRPLISAPLDLSTHLQEYMFVGFSASTGHLTQIHSIRSWNFSSHVQAQLRLPGGQACREKLQIISLPTLETIARPKTKRSAPSAFLVFLALVGLCLIALLNIYWNRRKTSAAADVPNLPDRIRRPHPPNKPRHFSMAEVSSATRCFDEKWLLGGSRGFHRGTLPNGTRVAVKRFLVSHAVDRRRLLKEIRELSHLRHPKLVSIRGWCCERKKEPVFVVYEYLQNGGLDLWLHARDVLPWGRRVQVLLDVAEGLCFLHGRGVAHGNVKASSVLLDAAFRAVLGDFGFGQDLGEREEDVHGFGMLSLEIVSGRRSSEGLVEMAWRLREDGELEKTVDERLRGVFNRDEAVRVAELGLLCTSEVAARPSMEDVVGFLGSKKQIPELTWPRDVVQTGRV